MGRWGCYTCCLLLPPQIGSQGEDQFRPGPAEIGVCVTNVEGVLPTGFLPLAPLRPLAWESRLFACACERHALSRIYGRQGGDPESRLPFPSSGKPASFLPFQHLSVLVRCVTSRCFSQEVALGGWGHTILAEPEVPILLFQCQIVVTFHVQSYITLLITS